MDRPITSFSLDEDGVWVAMLSCGHLQHVRHHPPLTDRPWVMTEEGRNSRLGMSLNCVRCDHFELPSHFIPYSRTPVFTEATVPDGLRRDHSTKAGVWAKIIVMEGKLRYHIERLETTQELSQGRSGIVTPEVPHHVEPLGAVRFYVEFYRTPDHGV